MQCSGFAAWSWLATVLVWAGTSSRSQPTVVLGFSSARTPPRALAKRRRTHCCCAKRQPHQEATAPATATPTTTESKDRALGIAVLLTVPLCWGTYGPAVKYLYAMQPPVPGLVFSAAYYVVAALSLGLVLAIQSSPTTPATTTTATISTTTKTTTQGGIELGTYLFVANVLQVIGLQTVQADRAGFLVQLTTIMVPILEATLAANWTAVSRRTWLACCIALAGVIVIDLDASSLSSILKGTASGFSNGDLCILSAALVYSWHVVRLEPYAKQTTALRLAASKACTEALLSLALLAGLALFAQTHFPAAVNQGPSSVVTYVTQTGQEITSFFATVRHTLASSSIPDSVVLIPALAAVLWTGWVTCAYTIFAQSFGQGRVPPTQANLIYTVQPLFTALFAFVLLGETMGPTGMAGASLIAAAVGMVATDRYQTQ